MAFFQLSTYFQSLFVVGSGFGRRSVVVLLMFGCWLGVGRLWFGWLRFTCGAVVVLLLFGRASVVLLLLFSRCLVVVRSRFGFDYLMCISRAQVYFGDI